jgi:hypothetical protein
MEQILQKLQKIPENCDLQFSPHHENSPWFNWSLEEQKQLLELYLLISKKEPQIFDLIYKSHGIDTWEDIFRDYDTNYLDDKAAGVKIAIKELNRCMSESETKPSH